MARGKWLTPDTPPEHQTFTRRQDIPAALDFIGVMDGLYLELTKPDNWEQYGTMTPEETAQWFNDHYDAWTENQNDPPDADSADNLDGHTKYPWYEQLSDWIIEGFLAITFTTNAALVYQATVPKLRIAIRTGNIGALFRVLINGVEVWSGDSYSAITDVIDQFFDTSALTPPYTVRVEHLGAGPNIPGGTTPKLEYIREESVIEMVQTILRADPSGCGIQWSLDNGGTWETIDLATCITGLANDAIDQAIADGKIGAPGQGPIPGTPPAPNTCYIFNVEISANGTWACPIQVDTGDSVTIDTATGAWSDGNTFLDRWFCPDGHIFFVNICGPTTLDDGTDPYPTAHHMELIGHVSNVGYFRPLSGVYSVPNGTVGQQLTLGANDITPENNQGSIHVKVTVCKSACVNTDLTLDPSTWFVDNFPGWTTQPGAWVDGSGFVSSDTHLSGEDRTTVQIDNDSGDIVNPTITVKWNATSLGNDNRIRISTNLGEFGTTYSATGAGSFTHAYTGTQTGAWAVVGDPSRAGHGGEVFITEVDICAG